MSQKNIFIQKNHLLVVLLGTLVSLLSFNAGAANKTVATVNGKAIDQRTFDIYVEHRKRKDPKFDATKNRETLIQELVNRELMYQDALKNKLDKQKDVKFQLQQQRIDLLIKYAIQKTIQSKPLTDEELKKEYERRVKSANITEYKARHILLKDEEKAKEIIKELDDDKDFIELAKENSTGPTGKTGGDLGWFNARQMVPEFSKAVATMKKGTYTKTPVKTKFGWHVIKLEDTRKMEPPKFEDIKQQIRVIMQNKLLQEYLLNLRKKAKIKISKK